MYTRDQLLSLQHTPVSDPTLRTVIDQLFVLRRRQRHRPSARRRRRRIQRRITIVSRDAIPRCKRPSLQRLFTLAIAGRRQRSTCQATNDDFADTLADLSTNSATHSADLNSERSTSFRSITRSKSLVMSYRSTVFCFGAHRNLAR